MADFSTLDISGVNLQETFTPPAPGSRNISAQPAFAIGTQVLGTDGGLYVYTVAAGPVTIGDWQILDSAFNTQSITTANALFGSRVGVFAGSSNMLPGDYGWVQIMGTAPASDYIVASANSQLFTTTTPGALTTTSAAGASQVNGAYAPLAQVGQGTNLAVMTSPHVGIKAA